MHINWAVKVQIRFKASEDDRMLKGSERLDINIKLGHVKGTTKFDKQWRILKLEASKPTLQPMAQTALRDSFISILSGEGHPESDLRLENKCQLHTKSRSWSPGKDNWKRQDFIDRSLKHITISYGNQDYREHKKRTKLRRLCIVELSPKNGNTYLEQGRNVIE